MKSLKIKVEIQAIPAIGFVIGYDDFGGLVIMIPFVSVTIKRDKKKRIEPVLSKNKGVDIKKYPPVPASNKKYPPVRKIADNI